MSLSASFVAICVSAVGSLVFSTLTYALRDLSRVRLGDYLQRHGSLRWLEPTMQHLGDLIFVTAVGRLLANTLLVLTILESLHNAFPVARGVFWASASLGVFITFFCSVAFPHALANSLGSSLVGGLVRPLHALRVAFGPAGRVMHWIESGVRTATGVPVMTEPALIEHNFEQEILSVVEEGEKDGVVDVEEREMIESVMGFGDNTAGQIMTPRADLVAIPATASLLQVRQTIESSSHSRLPVYQGTLDQVVGILYARDLLHHLTLPPEKFNATRVMRPAYFIPETKTLKDLLSDFRLQKVHIAVVLDEYGGTVGLVTIEDMLEELIGDISDEHEPVAPAMYRRIDEHSADVDARIRIDELNRLAGLNVPEDAGYETLGGFVSTSMGRIPPAGATFEQNGARFTVVEAEPQRINRVRVDHLLQPVGDGRAAGNAIDG